MALTRCCCLSIPTAAGETWCIAAPFARLTALVSGLLSARLLSGDPTTDDVEFIAACKALAVLRPKLRQGENILSYFRVVVQAAQAPPPHTAVAAATPVDAVVAAADDDVDDAADL